VAAEIIAGRPPRIATVTAIVKEANRPTRGSTPAMIENEMASGIRARATTSPARTSVRRRRGERSAFSTDCSSCGVVRKAAHSLRSRDVGATLREGELYPYWRVGLQIAARRKCVVLQKSDIAGAS
jgi:hypothetical protein